jgi:23S rRNA (cytidine1920-2'-O)/16S rRNA (cytidine1409-2'-O)-methyltransferase
VAKTRLDAALVARGLAADRDLARRLILAGEVWVDRQRVILADFPVAPHAEIRLQEGPRFVSRGGEKLEAALQAFNVNPAGKVCADIGASTGGFTDCLLQSGAARVYALDVGSGILHWKLRQDARVVAMEGTNARFVQSLPEPATLITVDASFISLKTLLPVLRGWLPPDGGEVAALIKPQFEADRSETARTKGVIRSPEIHHKILRDLLGFSVLEGFTPLGVIRSPLTGPKGNVEFLAHFCFPKRAPLLDWEAMVQAALLA